MGNEMVTEKIVNKNNTNKLKTLKYGINSITSLSDELTPFVNKLNHGSPLNVDITLKGLGNNKLIIILGILTIILFVSFIICFIGWLSCKKVSNYKDATKNGTVIFFHHNGCHHCVNFKQTWNDTKKTLGGYKFIEADTSNVEYNNIFNNLTDDQLHQPKGAPRGVPTIIKINKVININDLQMIDEKDISVYTDYPRTTKSFNNWLKK